MLALSLSSVLFGASCTLSQEFAPEAADQTGEATEEIGGFSASLFVFTTMVADDGKGPAGGWQVATATLDFKELSWSLSPKSWRCRIKIEMPIRSSFNGIILPEYAAQISAAKATNALSIVMHSQPEWPLPELFCRAFAIEMERGVRLYEPAAKVNKV